MSASCYKLSGKNIFGEGGTLCPGRPRATKTPLALLLRAVYYCIVTTRHTYKIGKQLYVIIRGIVSDASMNINHNGIAIACSHAALDGSGIDQGVARYDTHQDNLGADVPQ